MTHLARLLDPGALDADEGPHARARITVPVSWAAALVEVALPRVMECARCDGGGCDGCARSGALRGPEGEAARVVRVRLPDGLGEGVMLRLSHPFGRLSVITQLRLEVRPGEAAPGSVRRLPTPADAPSLPCHASSGRPSRGRQRLSPEGVLGLAALALLLGLALVALAQR